MSIFLQPLQTVTVGSGGASSVTFTSIPQGYTDLVVKTSVRSQGTNGTCVMFFNSDTTQSNYSVTRLYGNSSSAGSAAYSAPYFVYSNESNFTSNTFTNGEVYIPNYTSSNYKSVISDMVNENNATLGEQFLSAGLWRNTSAITSITIQEAVDAGFVQYSKFSLYGVLRQGI